jgi:aryl carrier-like protein
LTSLGEAWAHGVKVDWAALFAGSGATAVELPTYAFQRKRCWLTVSAQGPAEAPVVSVSGEDPDSSFLRLLSGEPEEDRGEIVLRAVREQVAAVLGDTSPESIDTGKSLLELGVHSMAAMELRNRLIAMTGLRIPASVMFDLPTTGALADLLCSRLGTQPPEGHDESYTTAPKGTMTEPEELTGTFTSMLRYVHGNELADEFMGVLMAASRFRPAFDLASARSIAPVSVTLSNGPSTSELICLPPVVALSGPHQYARFAGAFQGSRTVSALALPGFAQGERVPESLDAVIEMLAVAVERRRNPTPIALAGYSSGGWLAHAVASRLERAGGGAAAVVLIDTYPSAGSALMGALGVALVNALTDGVFGLLTDDRLMGMGAYLRLLADWRPVEIGSPTLLVRASEPLGGLAGDDSWRTRWELPHETLDTPGDHLAIIEGHAESTARAVDSWLSRTLDHQDAEQAC